MNRGQGLFAGAILAAAFLLRPLGVNAPQNSETSQAPQTLLSAKATGGGEAGTPQEGPWLASCSYWAPARLPSEEAEPSAKTNANEPSPKDGLSQIAEAIKSTADKPPQDPGCGAGKKERWGFPAGDAPVNVTAIIATVPDPVHTHLAMTFDRTLNVLLQAAEDNDYVSSHYWLPWPHRTQSLKGSEDTGEMEPGHDPMRERQPGLVILKHVPEEGEDQSLPNSYYKVIFLFLVGETPTKGVDGFQLRNAFAYESELAGDLNKFSRGKAGAVSIIGPDFSGSAASLKAGINSWGKGKQLDFFVMGNTSATLSCSQLRASGDVKVDYYSFAGVDGFDSPFLQQIHSSGYGESTFAKLIEDNTAFGTTEASPKSNSQTGTVNNSNAITDANSEACRDANPKTQTVANSKSKAVVNSKAGVDATKTGADRPFRILFPREISLLRNAEVENDQSSSGASPGSVPSPYLHFSVKDRSAQDSVPKFSRENTPLSQEAQLMMIDRQLQLRKINFVEIAASNRLDEIFLAQFLHRAFPDTQLVLKSDNLLVRDADNAPFISSISIGPYPLMGLGLMHVSKDSALSKDSAVRALTDSVSAGIYNAAKYIFWQAISSTEAATPLLLHLQGYLSLPDNIGPSQPPLWATTVGRDGYYPLGILNFSAGGCSGWFLPPIDSNGTLRPPACSNGTQCPASCLISADQDSARRFLQSLNRPNGPPLMYSPLPWRVLAWLVLLLCFGHFLLISDANYWSRLTQDLAIDENDQPHRRSMYIHVATAALYLLAFIVSCPMLALFRRIQIDLQGKVTSILLLVFALAAMAVTFWKTREYCGWSEAGNHVTQPPRRIERVYRRLRANIYFLLIWLSWASASGLALIWFYLCSTDLGGRPFHAVYLEGVSFSYRCIHTMSGVSPLPPVFLLLLSWYFWGFFQTRRLRFSKTGRPHLTDDPDNKMDRRFLISDQDIGRDKCRDALYNNIECLMFTTKLFRRRYDSLILEALLASVGIVAVGLLSVLHSFRSFDHFLWKLPRHLSSPYEFLIGILLFPMLWLVFAGWLRLIFIWATLKSGLLNRLEDQPIRFALERLKGMGWMTMLSRVGLQEQWRDMDRCIESMCQMLNYTDFRDELDANILQTLSATRAEIVELSKPLRARKLYIKDPHRDYELRKEVDLKIAAFGRELLSIVLIPYWENKKSGTVESEQSGELPIQARRSQDLSLKSDIPIELHARPSSSEPPRILMAEEFIAIRYRSLIRAVLANMRYLMSFVALTFVLTMLAWNSYPFHPRQFVDWFATVVLVILGSGMIWVFGQMHRDPILSRVTDTKPNVLGWDFYVRIVSYGAIPVLTWLAYEFPDVGNAIYRFILPGTSVFK